MTTLSKPSRSLRTTLLRFGDLVVNQLAYTTTEYNNLGNNNWLVGSSIPADIENPTPDFTHLDAGTIAASSYDDYIIDTQPIIKADGSIIVDDDPQIFRHMQLSATPFWLLIRCSGYDRVEQQTRDKALALAKGVMSGLVLVMDKYRILNLCKGFAFLSPDLNVVFPDFTVIDRSFQSELIQECHAYHKAACVITSRPSDITTMIAPKIEDNANSGLALAYPIIGTHPAYTDRILVLYPDFAATIPNMSIVMTQVASGFSFKVRDGGFTPNLEWSYVLPYNISGMTADGVTGTANPSLVRKRAADLIKFVAACGITNVGIQSGPLNNYVADINSLIPATEQVNNTGRTSMWTRDSVAHVRYENDDGTVTERMFNDDFVEILG